VCVFCMCACIRVRCADGVCVVVMGADQAGIELMLCHDKLLIYWQITVT
jgi:hypothetical protein